MDSLEFHELETEFMFSTDIIAGDHKDKKIFHIQDMKQNAKFQALHLMIKDRKSHSQRYEEIKRFYY